MTKRKKTDKRVDSIKKIDYYVFNLLNIDYK